jgi:hypothetical protein
MRARARGRRVVEVPRLRRTLRARNRCEAEGREWAERGMNGQMDQWMDG